MKVWTKRALGFLLVAMTACSSATPGSGTSGSTSGSGSGARCKTTAGGCSCTAGEQSTSETTCTKSTAGAGGWCEAFNEFPKSGFCACAAPRCWKYTSDSTGKRECVCGWIGGSELTGDDTEVDSCDPSTEDPACCYTPDSGICGCYSSCNISGAQKVAKCTPEVFTPKPSSSAYRVVESCNVGGSSSSSSSSGGECPGSGYVSCTSSADCSCGLTCSRLTSSSTDKYCTQSCTTDSDCTGSKKWSFSSIGCNPATSVCIPE